MRHRATPWGSSLFIVFCTILSFATISGAGNETPQPVLQVRGANDKEGLKISTDSFDFRRPFFVDSMNKTKVDGLRIDVADFVGPDSQLVETGWTVDGKPGSTTAVSVSGLESVKLEISAKLAREGAYVGSIILIYNDKRCPVPIVVTRSRPGSTIKILELVAARDNSFRYSSPEIRMTIQETGGLNRKLSAPQVTTLVLKEGEKAKVQAQFDKVFILNDDNKETGDIIEIGPNQIKRLKVRISNLQGPGEFSGTVQVGDANSAPVEQTFTIFVKTSWLIAAIFIALGVACSFFLNCYYKKDRPRMVLSRRVLRFSSEVETIDGRFKDLTDAERTTLDSFRTRLENLYDDVDLQAITEKDVDAMITEIDKKLSVFIEWVNARRHINEVKPPEIVAPLRPELDIGNKLTEKGTSIPEIDKLRDKLVTLEKAITNAVRSELGRRLDEFLLDVEEQKKGSSAELVATLTTNVVPKIEAAKNKANINDLAEAQLLFNEARKLYAGILAGELETRLIQDRSVPTGIPQPDWEKVVNTVSKSMEKARQEPDPDSAIKAYQDGYSYYLQKLIEALRERSKDTLKKIDAIPVTDISTEKKNQFKQNLSDIVKTLDGAVQKLLVMQLRGAAIDYAFAKKNMEDVDLQLPQMTSLVSKGAIAVAQPGGTILPYNRELPIEQVAKRAVHINQGIGEIAKKIKQRDRFFIGVILVISVLLGLKLLWADDPTWGGVKAYLIAVLWGFGLHQVSGAAFEGAAGLMEKLSK